MCVLDAIKAIIKIYAQIATGMNYLIACIIIIGLRIMKLTAKKT